MHQLARSVILSQPEMEKLAQVGAATFLIIVNVV